MTQLVIAQKNRYSILFFSAKYYLIAIPSFYTYFT